MKLNKTFDLLLLLIGFCTCIIYAQGINIDGWVRDINTYREIVNVNIFIKGTQSGTTSNYAGKYQLRLQHTEKNLVIVFRHIAYEPVEIYLDSLRRAANIFLQPRVIPLIGTTIEKERIQRLQIAKDLPQTVALLQAQNFEIRGYMDAGDLLRTDHSIQVKEELTGKKTVAIRGGNPDDVLVLYNGIRMNSMYDNVFDLSFIDLQDIDRFEIIKGSNTALYGSEAFSGVINIVPQTRPNYKIRFQQRVGTYRSGNWGLHLNHNYQRFSGNYSYKCGGTVRNFADMPAGHSLLVNSSLHQLANMNYSFSDFPQESPANCLSLSYVHNSLHHKNERDQESLHNFFDLFSLQYAGDIGKIKGLDFTLSLQRLQEVQFLMIGPGALDRNLNGITYHLNAQKTFSLNKVEVLCGYQYNFEELDFVDERQNFVEAPIGLESAEFQRQLHGLVSIAKLHGETNSNFFQAIDVDLSFRYDQLANKQKNPIIRDKSSNPEEKNIVGIFNDNCWQETALKFALNLPGYHQNLIFNGNINFGINKKFPTLLQQISSPARLYSADAEFNLQPEKNVSTEVNLNLGRDIRGTKNIYGWKISGNFFQNLFENKFRASTTPGMPVQFYDNVPNASLSGFESASSVFLFKKKMTMELGISRYFISEKSAFPFKSDFKRTMTVTFDHAGFSFQLHWFKEGEQVGWIRQQDGSFAEIVLAEYSNLDLHLSSTFRLWKMKFFANVSGRNLLNDGELYLSGLAIRDRRFYLTIGAQY